MKKFLFTLLFCLIFQAAQINAAQMNKIAATVNGQVITMFDLQKEAIPDLARAQINPHDASRKGDVDKILRRTLDSMILDILVTQEAKRLNATVTSSEIDNAITQMMKDRGLKKKQFEAELARQNLTVEALRKNIEKSIIRQKIMAREVGRKVIVTPEEIQKYYDEHKDTLINREGLHMGVLVYSPKVNAASIAAQIKSGKLSFSEACSRYSIAPNKDRSGDTGAINWSKLNPEWDARLNSMMPGDVTDIFELQGHKAQVFLFRPGGGEEKPLSLEEARPQIDAILRQPKAKGRFEDYSRQLRKKAVIDIRL